MRYYLAIDIGASSGRHILSHMEQGKMITEEIYRFDNGIEDIDGVYCWNHERLFNEILKGMSVCKDMNKIPVSVGVDTWGVDFVLLDENGNMLGNAVSYRDERTKGMDKKVYEYISEKELYERTGIQKAMYNTIYQLMALKTANEKLLQSAKTILFTPDYFHYRLSGVAVNEYTIASTSQLLNPERKDWDMELVERLGYPKQMFGKIVSPGICIGSLTKEVAEIVGYDCKVVVPPSHDTASAVVAVPSFGDTVYISSGTWSLMGVETDSADCGGNAMQHNMTNEGGYNNRFRFLKNIMGLWMIQSVKKESETKLSFGEISEAASKETICSTVDCYDDRFLAPDSMTQEIKKACRESNQPVPENLFETAAVIYNSLAKCYADTINEIEELTGKHYDSINVVGGGSNAVFLNELTAKYTKRCVYAGPGEATAIGNLAVQMITDGEFTGLKHAKEVIYNSFAVKKYEF